MKAHHKFSELRARKTPERRARNQTETARLLGEMPLATLQPTGALPQVTAAELRKATQSKEPQIEERTDHT